MDKPSIGKIVHYVSYGTPGGEYSSVCRAAVITEVETAEWCSHVPEPTEEVCEKHVRVAVVALNPTGMFFHTDCAYSGGNVPGSWHWPERV